LTPAPENNRNKTFQLDLADDAKTKIHSQLNVVNRQITGIRACFSRLPDQLRLFE
jgi:hypothetical protein